MDLEKAKALEKEAEKHDGLCTNCHQTIKIYRYGISTSMVRVLKTMARATDKNSGRAIDVDDLKLKHSERTQLTKMRFHGLVAKVTDDGKQIPRHWLITRKGWAFLGGETIQSKVIVYNNQVLGHDGGTTEIKRIDGEADDYDAIPISEAESRTYAHVRQLQRHIEMQAEYCGRSVGGLENGKVYDVKIDRLQFGKPVVMVAPYEATYNDIAAFRRQWKAIS